jgi:hypothetical protein
MGGRRNAYSLPVGKPKGKRPLRRPRGMCLDNIKINLIWAGFIWLRTVISGMLL